ncbi:hypothetical protein LCGC14_1613190 [marine sediment metagenome]|uniref:Uncharacterized protein n=1 Tax=marine sediment metagenome TaxID=412755 RepID=A0A0F9IUH1_9ZZZZ
MDKDIEERLKQQSILFRELLSELDGKVMNYETCRMLEDFLNEYSRKILEEIEKAFLKIKEEYDLIPKKKEDVK